MSYYLAIVGKEDKPLYELEFGSARHGNDGNSHFAPAMRELNPFILHASLDIVDELQWTSDVLYQKSVDSFYNFIVSAFITPGNVRILLLHEMRNEEAIRQFLTDIWDLYVKTLMSPFYQQNTYIDSISFDTKVKQLCRKYF